MCVCEREMDREGEKDRVERKKQRLHMKAWVHVIIINPTVNVKNFLSSLACISLQAPCT